MTALPEDEDIPPVVSPLVDLFLDAWRINGLSVQRLGIHMEDEIIS
jgi:hypothetical protein